MFGQTMTIQSAYQTGGLEAEILGSSPHRLIKLLFDGAFAYIGRARAHMVAGETQAKAEAITRAVDVISRGLRASLNVKQGGDLAKSLDELYEYIGLQLVKGHLQNDPAMLDEATNLLRQIADAWEQIGKEVDRG